MLKGLTKRIYSSDFLKSLTVLVTGTIIAQSIGYLLAPVITRIYTPQEMGEFAIFQRIVVLIATVATARYELALPLPKKDKDAFYLFRFSLKLTIITTVSTAICAIIYGLLNNHEIEYYLLTGAGVISVFALAFFNLGTNWSIRMKSFKRISLSKMTSSFSNNGFRVIFGLLNWGYIGLIISFLISYVVGASHFVRAFFKSKKASNINFEEKKDLQIAKTYKDFPLASLPHALSDVLRDVLVAFIIIELFSESIFGSFDHSFRMLRLPIMIIGASMSQVFFNRISDYKKKEIPIYPLFKKLLLTLSLLSIVPFAIIFLFGEEIFGFVFGSNWYESGKLSEIMAPWLMLNFILSPLSTIPLVFNKQRSFFILGLSASLLQLFGFLYLPQLLANETNQLYSVFQWVTWSQVAISIVILFYLNSIVKKHDLLLK
jgi:O-antigen/teichoic acid export membrane protein